MTIEETIKPKNSVLSIKGIIIIVAIVIAVIGAITLWAVLNGTNTNISYYSGLLVLITFLALAGFIMGIPIVFAISAVIFFVAAPTLIEATDALRRTPNKNDDARAAMAGMIILLFGSGLSFVGVPSEGLNWTSIIDVIVATVIAVFYFIGGAILGNIGQIVLAVQVYILLVLLAVAIVFGSKSLMYTSMILSTYFFCLLLPTSFPSQPNKSRAAFVISWIGATLNMIWAAISIAVLREEKDKFEEAEGSSA